MTSNSNHISEEKVKNTLKDTLETVKEIFNDMSMHTERSSMLLDAGIKDSLAQFVDESLKDPLKSSFTSLMAVERSVKAVLHSLVVNFLKTHKNIIKSVHRYTGEEKFLHYSIVLKKNTLNNRAKLFEFLNRYEYTNYSQRFPIHFLDIPTELVDNFYKEIINGKFEEVVL